MIIIVDAMQYIVKYLYSFIVRDAKLFCVKAWLQAYAIDDIESISVPSKSKIANFFIVLPL